MRDLSRFVKLLNVNPSDMEDDMFFYVKRLRQGLAYLIEENSILRKEALLPYLTDIDGSFRNVLPTNEEILDHLNGGDLLFITITFDPRKFPQIIVCSEEQQKLYFEQVLTLAIINEYITHFFGVYETQKNGNIHLHFITKNYNNIENRKTIREFLSQYLTDRKDNKYCVDIRPVKDINGLLNDYLKKDVRGYIHNINTDEYEWVEDDFGPYKVCKKVIKKSLENFI